MYIPFGPWVPDAPRQMSEPHLREAKNCVPLSQGGYAPAYGLVDSTDDPGLGAISTTNPPYIQGAASFQVETTPLYFAAVKGKLWAHHIGTSGAWSDVTRAVGGDYDAQSITTVNFAQFENKVIATNGVDDVQVRAGGTTATQFAALGGSPPDARYITTFKDFVVLGGLATDRYGIAWSATGDETGWTPGTNLSDVRSFLKYGYVTAVAGTKDALYVFCERGVIRGTYVGLPNIIYFDEVTTLGLSKQRKMTQWGDVFFYISGGRIYQLSGMTVEPVTSAQIETWLLQYLAEFSDVSEVNLAYDEKNGNLLVKLSANASPCKVLVYNIPSARPSYYEMTITDAEKWFRDPFVSNFPYYGITEITALRQINSTSVGIVWFKHGAGTSTATFETNDIYDKDMGRRLGVKAGRPNTGGNATVALAARETMDASVTFSSAIATGSSGRASVRANGRYMAAQVKILPGGFSAERAAQGIELETMDRGRR